MMNPLDAPRPARPSHPDGTLPGPELRSRGVIWVFGSNLAGRHGKGAALVARREFGAVYGVGRGLTGQAYAIPTKDLVLRALPITEIEREVKLFLSHARQHPGKHFFVTRIGCDLAGYCDAQIAPMFADAPPNCDIAQPWADLLEKKSPQVVDPGDNVEQAALPFAPPFPPERPRA